MTMLTDFCKKNIENKKGFMQKEHEKVLQVLYDNACEQNAVKEFELQENIIPYIPFADLLKKIPNTDIDVLQVCLTDLKHFGFANSTMSRGRVDYTITKLGLKYIEYCANQGN